MAERKFTTWHPDTCDCIIEYYNDDGSYKATVKACAKHSDEKDTPAHCDVVMSHNKKKNAVLNELIANHGLDIQTDAVFVGYDRTATRLNDPVIISGLSVLKAKNGGKTKEEILLDIKAKVKFDDIIGND